MLDRALSRAILILSLMLSAIAQAGPFGRQGTIKLRVNSPEKRGELLNRGARVVGDYGAFSIMEAPSGLVKADDDVEDLPEENVVLLNAGPLDTRQDAVKRLQRARGQFSGKSLHMIQFAGPTQPAWLDELSKTGVTIVTYIPSNTYLVYGDAAQIAGVQALSGRPHVQWDGAYEKQHKIHPAARAGALQNPKAAPIAMSGLYDVQLIADAGGNVATLNLIKSLKAAGIRRDYTLHQYHNLTVKLPGDKLDDLANQPDVISIQPYVEPQLMDECQDQIVAGNLSGNIPSGPGYLAWLASQGFTQAQFTNSGFVVDVTDSGIDNATTSPNHFGLYVGGVRPGTSRVAYNRLEGTANSGSTLEGCDGHGNLNSHIIAGYDSLSGFPFQDANGFEYGLGVAPFVRVGSSVIFDPGTFTFPDYSTIQSQAYQDNARISSNSWGGNSAGAYTTDSQTYDALVRDAQPISAPFSASGNQEMVIVFANGNAGSAAQTVGEPATAKNVISVGAAENVCAFGGSDHGGIGDSGADNANDIISFSSRGPCADGRKKPDIVAPGTHVTGGVIQTDSPSATGTADACYNGTGVTGGVSSIYFPSSGQQFYTASSGTSHSTPCVAGGCALIRQWFINQGFLPPSPAMTKAFLMNSARYLTGVGANDTLWSNSQGMGEMNLSEAFNRGITPTLLRDELGIEMFTASGQVRSFSGTIADNTKPLRVTLAWTDAPGPTSGAAYKNNLDLTVTVGGNTYKGNVFSGASSVTGGSADVADNVESVFLPAGVSGSVAVNVTATNINSDGVPNVGGALDQDFAIVGYNIFVTPVPVVAAAGSALVTEGCSAANGVVDPGETVTVNFSLKNIGTGPTGDLVATLQATGGVNASSSQDYGAIAPNSAPVARPFTFIASGTCGGTLTATLQLQDGPTNLGTVTFSMPLGTIVTTFTQNFDGVAAPALPLGWTATVAQGSPAAWATTAAQRDTLPNSIFAPDPATVSDNRLTSPGIAIASSAAQLTFRHFYNCEYSTGSTTLGYDGGVLEISIAGGAFTDIITPGGSFITGGYVRTISSLYSSPLANRMAWSGNSGGFATTAVQLPASAAGQNVQLRWRFCTDNSTSATGWYVDSMSIAEPVCCVTPLCHTPFADADGDGDVDQSDFAQLQLCAGTNTGYCACFDRNANGQVDSSDFDAFDQCEAGANVPPQPTCTP